MDISELENNDDLLFTEFRTPSQSVAGSPARTPRFAPQCSQGSSVGSNSMFSAPVLGGRDETMSDNESCASQGRSEGGIGPSCYRFENTIFDSNAFPFPMEPRYFDGNMVPRSSDLKKLYSQGKMVGCVGKSAKDPAYGITWSFVDELSGMGMTEYLMKVVYFFRTIELLSHHHSWNGFVTATNNLTHNLHPQFAPGDKEKDIIGVIRKATIEKQQPQSLRGSRGVDMRKLLEFGDNASGGPVDRALPILDIDVSFTGANYRAEGEGKKMLFGVVTVHWLLNVHFMPLFLVSRCAHLAPCPMILDLTPPPPQHRFLAPPKASAGNFEALNKRRNELIEMFDTLLVEQHYKYVNENSTLRPRDFWENPNGSQGAHTLCNPFADPFKMVNCILRQHPDASDIRIIGYPDIDWLCDPDTPGPLRDYLHYMGGYSGQVVEWCGHIADACRSASAHRFKAKRRKGGRRQRQGNQDDGRHEGEEPEGDGDEWTAEEHSIRVIPCWPVDVSYSYYCCWSLTRCPIYMKYRNLQPSSATQTFANFRVNFGGLPELVMCLMRKFLFFDDDIADSDKLNAINLRGLDVQWNTALIKKHFYSSDSKDNLQLVTSGCKLQMYRDVVDFIRESVREGVMTPHCAVRIMLKHFEMSLCTMEAMIDSGYFISDMMKQALEIRKRLYKKQDDGQPLLYRLLNQYQSHILLSTPVDCVVNVADFTRRLLLQCAIGINDNGQLLNSVNLYSKLSMIVSMVSYGAGRINTTVDSIGQGLEFSPCCGTAREIIISGNSRIEVTRAANPNASGKDMCVLKINEDHQILATLLRIPESLFLIEILDDFTKTSVNLACCLQMIGGEVISTPDPTQSMRFFAQTELRGEDSHVALNIMIRDVFPRGGNAPKGSMTTMEDSSKKRTLVRREHCRLLRLLLYCSNEKERLKTQEQRQTLHSVNHPIPPGATPCLNRSFGEQYYEIQKNKFEGRSGPLKESWREYAAMFAATQEMAIAFTGQLNDIGFVMCEINPATRATLDFILFYTHRYYESLFSPNCTRGRLLRLYKVYISRESAMTSWIKTTEKAMQYPDFNEAMIHTIADFQCDALALTSCGNLLYNMVYRCLSWVPCLVLRAFMFESCMPVVPVPILVQLLRMPAPPPPGDSPLRQGYERVSVWLSQCLRDCCFCNNPCGGGLCEYVSSRGTVDGGVEENGLFRVARKTNAWNEPGNGLVIPSALADEIWHKYGNQLNFSCSLSKESLTPAINDMLTVFFVDFGRLLDVQINDVTRHFAFFGILDQMQFAPYSLSASAKPAIAIQAAWMRDSKEAVSVGIGVHCIQLLLLGALIGSTTEDEMLHPQVVSDLARNLVKQILTLGPTAMTPNCTVDVMSFDCLTCELQPILIDQETLCERPDHFLRVQAEQFARSGDLSEMLNAGVFAPEDIMHNGSLFRWAELLGLGTNVRRVPATVPVTYYVEQRRWYCAYNQITGSLGVLFINGASIQFEFQSDPRDPDARTAMELLPISWHQKLAELGFILLPMIRRMGACVLLGEDKKQIGVLTSSGEVSGRRENFCAETFSYNVKTREGCFEKVPVLSVMDNLLPIGTKIYLKMNSQSAGPLLSRLSVALSREAQQVHALRVFLNSPNTLRPVDGKAYVAVLCQDGNQSSCETIRVDPWELQVGLDGRVEIESIAMGGV